MKGGKQRLNFFILGLLIVIFTGGCIQREGWVGERRELLMIFWGLVMMTGGLEYIYLKQGGRCGWK